MNTPPSSPPLVVGPVTQGHAAMWGVTGNVGDTSVVDGGPAAAYYADSNAAAHVLTAAELTGAFASVVLALTGALAAAANATTDTAANIVAALPSPSVGTTYTLRVINESSGAFAWTIVGGAGVTVTGTASIAQNTWRDFIVTVTAVATPAVSLQNVGTGTYS